MFSDGSDVQITVDASGWFVLRQRVRVGAAVLLLISWRLTLALGSTVGFMGLKSLGGFPRGLPCDSLA